MPPRRVRLPRRGGSARRVGSHRRRRTRWTPAAAILAVLVLGWGVWSYVVVIHPAVSRPARADAIAVLGPGSWDGRVEVALDLAERGLAPVVLISQPDTEPTVARICSGPQPAGVQIICFRPDPLTTRGEAREIRVEAAARGWHRIMVVTSTFHISRARMIVKRCFAGQVLMVTAREPTRSEWLYNLAYQPAAYVKAALLSGC